jgi:hypothetical protein
MIDGTIIKMLWCYDRRHNDEGFTLKKEQRACTNTHSYCSHSHNPHQKAHNQTPLHVTPSSTARTPPWQGAFPSSTGSTALHFNDTPLQWGQKHWRMAVAICQSRCWTVWVIILIHKLIQFGKRQLHSVEHTAEHTHTVWVSILIHKLIKYRSPSITKSGERFALCAARARCWTYSHSMSHKSSYAYTNSYSMSHPP